MIGDKVSLVQTRQRLEALRELGHYQGDVTAAWTPAATDALKKAQTALGINADGKWGPETEDAIHKALAAKNPTQATEAEAQAPDRKSRDVLTPLRIIGDVVAGAAVTGIVAAIVITRRRHRALQEPHDGV